MLPLVIITTLFSICRSLRLDECSSVPLGLESGSISDDQLTASSSFDRQSVGPQNARIRTEKASGAWCPKPQAQGSSYEFLQINLDRTHVITAIETQGRFGNGTGREFATQYMVDYLRPGSKWIRYRNRTGHTFMTANSDTTTSVIRRLDPPIVASRIRLVPHSNGRIICMRAELHGCVHRDGVLYYSTIPEGSRMGDYDLRDTVFEESELYTETGIRRGLGLLSDGLISSESPLEEHHQNATWIGWNKHQTGGSITLLYEFDQLRNFSEVLFAAYGHRMHSIDVIFSQDGISFPLSSQISSLDRLAANSTEKRYDLRVPLHRRMARKVRLSIKFAGDWLFLTEIHFQSVISNETVSDETVASEGSSFHFDRNIFSIAGLSLLFIVLTIVLCGILCMRRKRNEEKEGIYEHDIKRDLIITHMGGKSATQLFSPQFGGYFAGNIYGTDKTTTTSVSSKSTVSVGGKTTPPTWSEFHFPPPPQTPEERIYAEPCMTLPLLPSHKKTLNGLERGCLTARRPNKGPDLHYAAGNVFGVSKDQINRYAHNTLRIGEDLGEGKFTLIRECLLPDRRRVAYKTAKDRNNLQARKALLDELHSLSSCSHPNVVQLLGADETGGLLLELAEGGDAKHRLKTADIAVPLSTILSWCADVCSGMSHLEEMGLVHGHLTPSHVLIDAQGRAKVSSPRGPAHPAQLRYSAPESILTNQFSCKSDAWAYSVSVHELLTHCRSIPFEGMSNTDIVDNAERIMAGETDVIIPVIPETVPRGLREILSRCFDADPPSRPSFAQIYAFISRFHT